MISTSHTPLRILFVAAEVAPFASVGGLSQVMYFLPRAVQALGHNVTVCMPKYGTIDEKKHHITLYRKDLKVPTGLTSGVTELVCNVKVKKGTKKDPTIYFLENMEYFEKRANVYGYSDDPTRFALLCRGVLEFIIKEKLDFDLIHINDWHTSYLANYAKNEYQDHQRIKKSAIVLTIHNLAHQGLKDFRYMLPTEFDNGQGALAPFFSNRLNSQNALKRGIIFSDLVNTVSERYAREILKTEYGQGLDQLLKQLRGKLYGVLNGLDYDDFNPSTDTLIKYNYTPATLSERLKNKIELQKEFDLELDPTIPVLAFSSRLDSQKGMELITKVLPYLLQEEKVQFIILGEGDNKYREFFRDLEIRYPKRVGTHLMANWQLPRKLFAGADMLLLPSKFEPGGIVVMEAMRYGAVPVVRETGGLSDIVDDFDISQNKGTGFTFTEYNELAFYSALIRALEIYKSAKMWQGIVKRAMQADFSWKTSAEKYINLYKRAIDYHKEMLSDNPPEAFRR